MVLVFQSTLPQGERLIDNPGSAAGSIVSIHAPAGGATTVITIDTIESLPLRERGLKLKIFIRTLAINKSLPLRERGLKLKIFIRTLAINKSLPLRERGLKQR